MSSQPPIGGPLAIPQNGIFYTTEPPIDVQPPALKAVSQRWLLITGSAVQNMLFMVPRFM